MILFNHTSYMDAVIIASVLPGEPAFVAKKEFADQPFAGSFMRRLGVAFVERFDAAASLADAEAVTGLAKAGRLFVFFPEGTFTRRAGLLGFYMGAFKVAAEANLPVVPGILRGVRTLLRGDQWFPRRTPISVVIEEPIQPTGTDFTAMLALRDAARAAMLKHAGRAGSGRAGEAAGAGVLTNLNLIKRVKSSRRIEWMAPRPGCGSHFAPILYAAVEEPESTAEEHHGLDDPDPRRNLHRPRDQRLSARRILTLDFLVLGPRPA